MDGAYYLNMSGRLVRDGRLLGQVRDLLVMRKSEKSREQNAEYILQMQERLT